MEKKMLREILFQVDTLRRRMIQNFLIEIGLTPGQGQARIMQFLAEHDPVTQRVLAQACMLDVTTMSRTLDKMEQGGYLERVPNPGCRRSYLVRLTEKGLEKEKEVAAGLEALDEILCGSLSDAELGSMIEGLKMVQANLKEAVQGEDLKG